MREIEYRAKSRIGNNWEYGYLNKTCEDSGDKYWIDVSNKDNWNDSYEIDPDTVGQFTGLTDKNGKKIFEGDIVKFNKQIFRVVYEVGSFGLGHEDYINYNRLEHSVFENKSSTYSGCYNDNFISLWEIYWNFNDEENVLGSVEIIGNIYDNPELLGEEE